MHPAAVRASSILGNRCELGNWATATGLREATVLLHVRSIGLVPGLLGLLLDPHYEAPANWNKFSERPQRHLTAGAHAL